MADLKNAASTYAGSGPPDRATSIEAGRDEILAKYLNFPVGAIVGIQGILGNALTLIGTHTDLVSRLAIAHETNGKLKDFSTTTKTNFPPPIAEGCTGASSFTVSELIRAHASADIMESSGLTVGDAGVVATRDSAETLTNKTITKPAIADYTDMNHLHTDVVSGGILTGNGGAGFDNEHIDPIFDQFTTTDTTATVTLTTTTGALVIFAASGYVSAMTVGTGSVVSAQIKRDATPISNQILNTAGVANPGQTFCVVGADTPAAGSHTYTLYFIGNNGNDCSITANNLRMFAFTVV